MSGQLIGGVVGAVIGFYAGGNVAAGWAIGSAIGGALDPQRIDGPRLQDRRVQVSSYGAGIPILHGGTAGTGNVIWSTDLVEHDVEDGGKGGPVTTNHTYSVSCAILIGEGIVPGIRRIWADAKLVYDISETADAATQAASAAFASSFVFYTGSETQLPDPTMEAKLGVGNVSAYRGSAYVVFTDLALQAFGNRIPNFRFETGAAPALLADGARVPLRLTPWTTGKPAHSVGTTEYTYGALVTTSLATLEAQLATEGFATYLGFGDLGGNDSVFGTVPELNAGQGLNQIRLFYGLSSKVYTVIKDGAGGTSCAGLSGQVAGVANAAYLLQSRGVLAPLVYLTGPSGGGGDAPCYSTAVPTTYRYVEPISYNDLPLQAGGGTIHSGMASAQACVDGQLANAAASMDSFACGGDASRFGTFTRTVSQASGLVGAPDTGYQWGIQIVYAGCFSHTQVSTRNIYAELPPIVGWTEPSPAPKVITARRLASPPPSVPPVGDPCLLGMPAAIPGRPDFAIACDGTISRQRTWTVETGTFKQLGVVLVDSSNHVIQNAVGPVRLPSDPSYSDAAVWDAEAAVARAAGYLLATSAYPVVVTSAAAGTGDSLRSTVGDTTLVAVVTDLCQRAGMASALFNLTALAGITVQGFSIPRQMPARAAIVQLQQAFWWDFVESGRTIKAVLRGGAAQAAIGVEDLGASEGGAPPVAVVPVRGQETELPSTVNVAYPVRQTGYETGTQRARRTVTGSQQVLSLELAVVMTDERAAQVADVLMFAAWTNRTEREFSTTRKWARYEPTDLVPVSDGQFGYMLRITDRSEEGGVIKWKGVDEAPAAYVPIVSAAAPSGGVVGIRFDGPMKLELIDCPILLDSNDDAGFYAAGTGYRPGWPGGVAFESLDAGASYRSEKVMTRSATLGFATSALGNFFGGNTVDEANTVTVQLNSGTLSSITRAQLLSEGNAAILGNELFQFQRAELVSAGIYRLSGLLRGRRGTEQHMATHAVSDRFVLFDGSVYRVEEPLLELSLPTKWKGVTSGQTLADATAQDFTNTGAGLKPLSPVHLSAVDIGGGQRRVSWIRRSRIGGKWRDVPVPLGETIESYQIAVNAGPAVTTSASTIDLTAAPGDTISVWQISGTVGRGFPATVKI